MKRFSLTLLAGLAALAVSAGASAQVIKGSATVVTGNGYDKTVWITIYDLGKTRHLDYGCVAANGFRNWQSGTYLYGSFYYVRGEVKEGPNCGGRTLCDTTVQINPQSPGPVIPGGSGYDIFKGTKVTILRQKDPNKCYWRHDN
jgi:hypothetical protein